MIHDLPAATAFLATLNDAHPSIQFTMETAVNNRVPFVGMVIIKTDQCLKTCVYKKNTNKNLSSSPDLFSQECKDLITMFLKLKYSEKLIDSTITRFQASQDQNQNCITPVDVPVRITLPFIDQKSSDIVRTDLRDLEKKNRP